MPPCVACSLPFSAWGGNNAGALPLFMQESQRGNDDSWLFVVRIRLQLMRLGFVLAAFQALSWGVSALYGCRDLGVDREASCN